MNTLKKSSAGNYDPNLASFYRQSVAVDHTVTRTKVASAYIRILRYASNEMVVDNLVPEIGVLRVAIRMTIARTITNDMVMVWAGKEYQVTSIDTTNSLQHEGYLVLKCLN